MLVVSWGSEHNDLCCCFITVGSGDMEIRGPSLPRLYIFYENWSDRHATFSCRKKNNVFEKCTVSTAYHYKAKVILKNFANLWTWAQLLFPTVFLFTPLFGDTWSFQWKIRDWMRQWRILIFLYQWESYLTASHMFPVLLLVRHTLISHEQSPHLPVHWLVVERWRGVVVVGGCLDCVFECPWIYRGQGRRLVLESCW